MSFQWKYIALASLLIVGALGVLGIATTRSLFFLHSLAQVEPTQTVFGTLKGRNSPLLAGVEKQLVSESAQEITSQFSRYVYISGHNAPLIIGIRIKSLPDLAGWRAHRVGWIHIVSSDYNMRETNHTWLSVFRHGVIHVAKAARSPLQSWPVAIVQVSGSSFGLDFKAISAALYTKNGEQQIFYNLGSKFASSMDNYNQTAENANDLIMAMPSRVLPPILETDAGKELRGDIESAFHLTKGSTDIFSSITDTERIMLRIVSGEESQVSGNDPKGSTVSLAVIGNSDTFRNDVISRLQEEIAYENPERSAFRLPDGTIGFEYVPQSVDPTDNKQFNNRGCREFHRSNIPTVWVCGAGSWAAITTDPDGILAAIENQQDYDYPGRWDVQIPANFIPSKLIEKGVVYGSGYVESGQITISAEVK